MIPAGRPLAAVARIFDRAALHVDARTARQGRPAGTSCAGRVDTYSGLPVEKYELVSAPGFAFSTRAIAARTAALFVTSTLGEWKTTTFGVRTPAPSAFSVRWLAS